MDALRVGVIVAVQHGDLGVRHVFGDVVSGGNALVGVGEADLEHIVLAGGHVHSGSGGRDHEGALAVADISHSHGSTGGGGADQNLHAPVHQLVVGVGGLFAVGLVILALELKLDLGVAGVDLVDGQLGTVDHGLAVDGGVTGQGADGTQLEGLDLVAGLGGIGIAGTAGIAGIIGTAGTAGGQTEHHSRGHNKG